MTASDKHGEDGRPAVYARLARDAEHRHVEHTPPGWSQWVGWGIVAAIIVAILALAVVVHPW
jgi:hypothetical protein